MIGWIVVAVAVVVTDSELKQLHLPCFDALVPSVCPWRF
jgi:hypothetical protein